MPEALQAWDRVQLARAATRPHTLDYVHDLIVDFVELHGDRHFGDDRALVGGIGAFRGQTVVVVGHQKGANTRENLDRNFGMPRPEGYRKALRLMRLAEKFGFPLLAFVDTPAADPGLTSEERGQATAIAENLLAMASLRVPTVAVVIGEGGSGGALAISVADRLLMLENAIYAVASPEACATILWHDAAEAPAAAATMRVTASDLHGFGIVDEVIPEPVPAHEDPLGTIHRVGDAVEAALRSLQAVVEDPARGIDALLERRYQKYRAIGRWLEEERPEPEPSSPGNGRAAGEAG
ncbi:MAG: acetyl-CoA carboxylase carboxyltransferase subunit alpha [Thermomicrobiaceae bacterium]|nr:acetyl-CoA carboxylase carboxyltransferase subunit alpha [Thermomicrobiaceae bacterium]